MNARLPIRSASLVLWSIVLLLGSVGFAQDQCSAISQAKASTYGFHPATLPKAERQQKSNQMDGFWSLVKTSGVAGLACVRQLMAQETTDTYFLFDGASLLLNLDKSGASDQAILDGLARTDLRDVAPDAFISFCLKLGKRNVDIGPAAAQYLHAEHVTVFLPQHGAYKLDRTRGAILLYGSLRPALVDKYLIPELSSPNQEVRDTAAFVLSLNLTEESYKALTALGGMENFSKESRESVTYIKTRREIEVAKPAKYTRQQMLDKLARLPEMDSDINEAEDKALDNSMYATFTAADLDALREGRRKMIVGVSNESVEGYEEMSRILLNLINVLDLYPQYRSH
jgi:hypothetical protein